MGVLDRLVLSHEQWARMAPHIIGNERTRGSSGPNVLCARCGPAEAKCVIGP